MNKKTNKFSLNFIQVWINMVLHHRKIYPPQCFNQKTVFGRKVKIAIQGPLHNYITGFMKNLEQHQGKVKQIQIQIFEQESKIDVEKVVLSVQQLPPSATKQNLTKLKMADFIQQLDKQLTKQTNQTPKSFQLQVLMSEEVNIKGMVDHWGLTQKKQSKATCIETCSFLSTTSELISTFLI